MLDSIAFLQIMKTLKLMLMYGGQSQTNLIDTICGLKNEMQAKEVLPDAAGGKEGKMVAWLHAINNHFQKYKSVDGVLHVAPQTQPSISIP